MVSIDSVHQLTYFIAAKQLTAFPSPNEFNSYANLAAMDLYNYYNDERIKLLLKVKAGEELYVPPVLVDFVVSASLPPVMPLGTFTLPDDYEYWLAVTTPSCQADAHKVDYDKLTTYLNSTVDNPTTEFPIFVEYPDTIQVYPNPAGVNLTYLRVPRTVFWNYTVVDLVPVYNPVGSVDFDFDETELLRLVSRILGYMGTSIRDTELAQYAQQMTQGAS